MNKDIMKYWSRILSIILAVIFIFFLDEKNTLYNLLFFQRENSNGIYRAFTSQFLHGDFLHIVVNIVALLYFNRDLAKYQREIYNFYIFLIGWIGNGLVLLFFSDSKLIYIGISGAICSLLGALLVISYYKNTKKKNTVLSEAILLIILSYIVPIVSPLMHVAGLVIGALSQCLLIRASKKGAY